MSVEVRKRSIAAEIRRAKATLERRVDPKTIDEYRQAHYLCRHDSHPEDFASGCYLCLAVMRRRWRAKTIERRS